MSRRSHRCAVTAAIVACAALAPGRASGQSATYQLQDDRTLLQTGSGALEGDAGVMDRARRALAQDNPMSARGILDEWIRANERSASAYLPTAYRLRGDAWVALNDPYEALYDYETVVKQYPQSDEFVTALDRELAIAVRYAGGEKRRTLLFFWVDAGDIAVELFIRVQERLPGSQLAERAAIELADYYYAQREVKLAGEAYALYMENFPKGPNRQRAAQRAALCDIARFKGPNYESSSLIDAENRIEDYRRMYPAEAEKAGLDAALLTRLDESRAAQMFESAQWYLRAGDGASARFVLRRLLRDHPGTIAADRATEIITKNGWDTPKAAPPAPHATEAPGAPDAPATTENQNP